MTDMTRKEAVEFLRCCEELDTATAAKLRQCAALLADDWRPMSEAPKDGSEVIILLDHGEAMTACLLWPGTKSERWQNCQRGITWPGDAPIGWRPFNLPEGIE